MVLDRATKSSWARSRDRTARLLDAVLGPIPADRDPCVAPCLWSNFTSAPSASSLACPVPGSVTIRSLAGQ